MYRKYRNKIFSRLKLGDVFGIGSAVGGIAGAAGSVFASQEASGAARYAADRSYEGQVATNNANIQIANELNSTNIQNTRETNATNLKLAQMQNQWNVEQWNRENEYNSPVSQVERYKAAGLNPASLGGSASIPSGNVASADFANQQSPQANAMPQLVNPSAQSSQIMADGAFKQAEMIGRAVQGIQSAVEGAARIRNDTRMTDSQINKSVQDVKESSARVEKLVSETDNLKKFQPYQLLQMVQGLDFTEQHINLLKSQNTSQGIQNDLARIELKQNEIKLKILDATQDVLKKIPEGQYYNLCQQGYQAYQQGLKLKLENQFIQKNGLSMSAFAQIQSTAMNNMTLLEVTDKQTASAKYVADTNQAASMYAADRSYAASAYSSDKHLEGVQYSANAPAKWVATGVAAAVALTPLGRSAQLAKGGFNASKGLFMKIMQKLRGKPMSQFPNGRIPDSSSPWYQGFTTP